MSTIDKLVAQFVCKKWQRIIQSSQNTYILFNNIEINGNTDVSLLYSASKPIQETPIPPAAPAPTHTTLNLARFFRSSASKKPALPTTRPPQIEPTPNCRQNSANVDRVLKFLFTKLLNRQTFPLCLCVESITIKDSSRLTDKGVELIAMYCPELKYISLRNCANLKNASVHKLVEMCNNLKFIDLTGCYNVSSLITSSSSSSVSSTTNSESFAAAQTTTTTQKPLFDFKFNEFCKRIVNGPGNGNNLAHLQQHQQKSLPKEVNFNSSNYFYLQYVDLSYCLNVDDTCIRNVCKNCVFIKNLYLRRCRLITDTSLVYIAKYCTNLRELSLCECSKITDAGVRYLADERLILNSDSSGVVLNEHHHSSSLIDWQKVNSRKEEHCRQMRQMRSKFHIRYLSLAKCNLITDKSLIYLCKVGFFEQIKYLNLKGCALITGKIENSYIF